MTFWLGAALAMLAAAIVVFIVVRSSVSLRGSTTPWVIAWVILSLAAGAYLVHNRLSHVGIYGRTTAAPPSAITDPTDPAQRAALLSHARSLRFDSITHGARDRQYLDSIEINRSTNDTAVFVSRLASIIPEANAHRNSLGDLMSGKGRITAAVMVHDRTRGYPKLDLPQGLSYLWVDSFERTAGWWPDSGRARVVIIPDDQTLPVITRQIVISHHPGYSFNSPQARWTYRPEDAGAWWTCSRFGCCDLN